MISAWTNHGYAFPILQSKGKAHVINIGSINSYLQLVFNHNEQLITNLLNTQVLRSFNHSNKQILPLHIWRQPT